MAYALPSQESVSWDQPASRRRLPALLCMLATILSLALTSCATITLAPQGECNYTGDAPRPSPSYSLDVTPPIAADGVVYVGYDLPHATEFSKPQYAVAALRARDGAPLWRVPAAAKTIPLAIANGVLVAVDNELVGLRASDGAMLWRVPVFSRAVTLREGILYVVVDPNGVDAIRIDDGRILWRSFENVSFDLTAPVVDGMSVYVSTRGSLLALRTDTGMVRWTTKFVQWTYLPLAVDAGQLYVMASSAQGMNSDDVMRLNPATGASDGYALRLPTDTHVMYALLSAGVYYAILLPVLTAAATPPVPPSPAAFVAYRLLASGDQLLWRTPVINTGVFYPDTVAHDAQTFYFAAYPQGLISAYRFSDGAVVWQQRSLTSDPAGIVVAEGNLFEIAAGGVNPCVNPPVNQAPKIGARTTMDGDIVWTRALTVTL